MNAGRDYTRARAQAQANADRDGHPRVLSGYNGAWWIDRLDSFTRSIPDGAEIINPRGEERNDHAKS